MTIYSLRLKTLLASALILASSIAYAENNSGKQIQHAPIKNSQIPAPGTPLTLSFDLSGIRGVIARERLLVVRDGKLMDVPLLEGPVEGRDSLAHNGLLHAPLVELRYQAVITLADGTTVTSPSYTLRRACVPNIALAPIDDPNDSSVSERLQRYVVQSRDLERDLTQYENAIALLESLVGQMKEEQ